MIATIIGVFLCSIQLRRRNQHGKTTVVALQIIYRKLFYDFYVFCTMKYKK